MLKTLPWTVLCFAACATPPPVAKKPAPPAPVAAVQPPATPGEIHERTLTVDTHVDFDNKYFTPELHQGMELPTQVDLPKMEKGGLDAAFFIVYVGQGPLTRKGYRDALTRAMDKFAAVHRMTDELNSDQIELASTADDIERIVGAGKKVALIGVENAYPLGTDLARVDKFYQLGARYMSITHNGHNQFGDSNTNRDKGPTEMYGGLSDRGRNLVAALNRRGIMVDVSHASTKTTLEVAALSRAPVIASHSAIRALRDHTRNLTDPELDAIRDSGGVVQVVAFRTYLKEPPPGLDAFEEGLKREFGLRDYSDWNKLSQAQQDDYRKRYRAGVTRIFPVTVKDLVDHIDYAVKRIGIDHVGISSDFGGGGGIDGWNSAEETPNVTEELLRRGYSEQDIARLWGGNLLRVLRATEAVAARADAASRP